MKKQCISIALLFGLASGVAAQTQSEMLDQSYDRDFRLELSTGFGKGFNLNTIQATRYIWIGDNNRFNVGSGLRLSNSNFNSLNFNKIGDGKTALEKIDVDGNIFSLNLYLAAEFAFKGRFCLGVNSDFFGLLFGNLNRKEDPKNGVGILVGERNRLGVKSPDLSYNLFGQNRQGSNSLEIYSGVHVSKNIWVKIGFSTVYNQVVLNQALDKFENKSFIFSTGCRLRF